MVGIISKVNSRKETWKEQKNLKNKDFPFSDSPTKKYLAILTML